MGCSLHRKTIDTGTDRRERNTFDAVSNSKLQGIAVAASKLFIFPFPTTAPHRAHRVDHPPSWQPVAGSNTRFTGRAATDLSAHLEKLWPRGSVDRAVYST